MTPHIIAEVCGNPSADTMLVQLQFSAQQGEKYSPGLEQQESLKMLKLQPPALAKAMQAALQLLGD